ncbi:MAG TPA: hypothetical protein VFS55_00605 [Dokdonella sp.]|nr:hypothetical protein [Dokdonella sp.]
MKTVTRYQSDDGLFFETEVACRKHEALVARVAEILARLRPVPTTTEFANGEGFVQQDRDTFLGVQRELSALARIAHEDRGFDRHFDYVDTADHPCGGSFIGRLLDDGGPAAVRAGWSRLMCTDPYFREWGQPYYAANPTTGMQVDVGARI